jgi:folylpolyglutamate synthase
MHHLWAAFKTLEDKADDDSGKPAYFRFLTLLGFKIFLETQVDVAILEVGLGGRLDATNCVKEPVVCGVTPLGFDHMDLLGHTLPEIAREKAGIFKSARPAFSSPQREDAAEALREVADKVGTPLSSVRPLSEYKLATCNLVEDLKVGLDGAHQRENAALAVRLAAEWEVLSGRGGEIAKERAAAVLGGELPAEYIAGLEAVRWPGRGQIVHDYENNVKNATTKAEDFAGAPISSQLTFFLDGAHTAESMATCGRWFADAVQMTETLSNDDDDDDEENTNSTHRVLVFNCMQERDPNALLQPLVSTLHAQGALPAHALFVPPYSTYVKLGQVDEVPDLAWQLNLRHVYEKMRQHQQRQQQTNRCIGDPGNGLSSCVLNSTVAKVQNGSNQGIRAATRLPPLPSFIAAGIPAVQDSAVGAVLPSLQHTIDWLRRCVKESSKMKMQVLVTGSLYLVGDMLRILGNGTTSLNESMTCGGHGGSSAGSSGGDGTK